MTTILVVTQSSWRRTRTWSTTCSRRNIQAEDYIKSDPTGAQTSANTELTSLSGKPLKASVLPAAFKEITFTNDPDASSLTTDAQQAKAVGLLTVNRPQRHLRPRPAQQVAAGGRRVASQILR